jgi:hypothetical protein
VKAVFGTWQQKSTNEGAFYQTDKPIYKWE